MKLCHKRKCNNLAQNGRRFCKVCTQKKLDRRMARLKSKESSAGAVKYVDEEE